MKIVIGGGSGFLGRTLVDRFAAQGHEVIVLSRSRSGGGPGRPRTVAWEPDGTAGAWADVVVGADAVVNLAGEGLADRRWTAARKRALEQSRVLSTRSLVAAIARSARTRPVLVSGSAVGYYGDTGDRVVTEADPPGRDFLANLCSAWEAEADTAQALGCRVVLLRTGIVLARNGGALKHLLPPFQMFVGGPIASGRQFMSWIHRDDWMALVAWLIERRDAAGPFNAAAPTPVSNREFSTALGRALHRPSLMPVPRLALRLLVGEMADVALVAGQRVIPERAAQMGFAFQYPAIDGAMRAVLAG